MASINNTQVVLPPPHPPQPVNPDEINALTKLFTSFASTPILSGAKFGAPKPSGDHRNVKLTHSQRDLNTNGFKTLNTHRILNPFTNSFISITPAYETTTTTIQSPSGFLTLSLRVNSTPGANGAPATKQTLMEIFSTEKQELISSQYLDGYILTSTPFSPPQWSPDERHICFSFVSNQTISVLDKVLSARHSTSITTTTTTATTTTPPTPENDKDSKPQLKLQVEQALNKIFTDDRYQTHMDLGEQLNGIQYPYLLIYSINNHTNPLTTVHHASFYSSFMPTLFHFGPTIADKDQPKLIDVEGINTTSTTAPSTPTTKDTTPKTTTTTPHFTPYPIIFSAQPIFQHRLGTIFYSTRPSRVYASVVYLSTAHITPSTTIITPTQTPSINTPIQYQQPPVPITWCLTPDAHCTHGLEVFTPPVEPKDNGEQPQLYKPHLKTVNNYIDITYLEGHAYDDRWGMSNELRGLIKANEDAKDRDENKVDSGNDEKVDSTQDYLANHMFEFSNTYAELLTPHGTTLAVRVLRIPAAGYTKMISLLAQMTQYANLYHYYFTVQKDIIEGTTTTIKSSPQYKFISQLDELYKASLPQWPLQTGLLSTNYILNQINPKTSQTTDMPLYIESSQSVINSTLSSDELSSDLAAQFVNLIKLWGKLSPQSLLPVNPYSYGSHIGGNHTIHRITPELIIFNNSLRDTQTIQFIHYKAQNAANGFDVTTSILVPPKTSLESFATTQLNQSTAVNSPQDQVNSSALVPLVADGEDYRPVLTIPSPVNPKRITKLPQLPISTQFTTLPSDQEQTFTIDNKSYAYHHSVASLQVHDVCFNETNQQISLLVNSHCATTPPVTSLVTVSLNTFNDIPSELTYTSINTVYCPSMRFHTTPAQREVVKGQVYTPYLFHTTFTPVQQTQFSPLLDRAMQRLHNITVDMRPYNSFGQSQLIVTYDRQLYSLADEKLIGQPRGDQHKEQHKDTSPHDDTTSITSTLPRGVILLPHGGPHSHFETYFDLATSYLATLGYMVLRINYSGSPSYGETALRSLMGYIGYMDTTECLFSVDTVCHLFGLIPNNPALADEKNDKTKKNVPIYYFGGSHSGYLGGFVSIYRHFASLVIRNPVLSLHTTGSTSDIYDWVFSCLGMIPQSSFFYFSDEANQDDDKTATPQEQFNLQDKMNFHSPITYIHHIKTPTLLEIGGGDKRVPCLQSNVYSKVLNQNGYHSMVNFYPTAQHSLADTPHVNSHSLCSAVAFFYRFAPQQDNKKE